MKNNRVLFSTIVVLLWAVNTLNLQPHAFELRTTVAISKHRVPLLQSLAKEQISNSRPPDQFSNIRVVGCEMLRPDQALASNSPSPANDADLQTMKLRVRYQKFTDVNVIEKWLEEQTRPQSLSSGCQQLNAKLRAANWRLDSLLHTQRVLQADQTRQNEQLALKQQTPPTAIKLVGFQRPESESTATQRVIDSLVLKIEDEKNNINKLSTELHREVAVSNGFLQFSGAPKWFPVAESIGWKRGFALIVLSVATWGVCRTIAMNANQWLLYFSCLFSNLVNRDTALRGLPHLGHVALMVDRNAMQTIQKTHSNLEVVSWDSLNLTSTERISNKVDEKSYRQFFGKLITTSGLIAWAALVTVRLLFDPAWRSLFVSAPLAAISNLVSGVGL